MVFYFKDNKMSRDTVCSGLVGGAYMLHNQENKQKPPLILSGVFPCPWTQRNTVCSVLDAVTFWRRHSAFVCLELFLQLLLLLLSFHTMLSRSHVFMSSEKASSPVIENLH